jgi:pimeloyl-ACP methyl ester carboxylesterase
MKSVSIKAVLVIGLALPLASCQEDFEVSSSANDFFHIKHDNYFMPVLVRGNTASRHILLFVQGGPANNTMDFARIDYPGFKNTIERDYGIAYYEPRGMGNRQGNFDMKDISVDKYLEDIHQVAQVVKKKYNAEVHLFGHSFGGYLTYLYMIRYGTHGVVSKYISANGPATTDHDLTIRWKLRHDFLVNEAMEEIANGNNDPAWREILDWTNAHPLLDTDEERDQWNLYVEEKIYLRYEEKLPTTKDYLKIAFFSSYNPLTANLDMSAAATVERNIIESQKLFVLVNNLSMIDKPILILTGRHDDVCTPEEVGYIMDNISSAEKVSVIIPDAGHQAFHHQPELFGAAIRNFIK